MIILTLIAFLLTLTVVAIKLRYNYIKWEKGDYAAIKHQVEWQRVVMGCLPSIVLFTYSSERSWFIQMPEWVAVVLTAILSAVMCAFIVWFLFDGLFNICRKIGNKRLGWWYLGTDDLDDAKTDNFLQNRSLWVHIVIKVIGIVGTMALYYFTYN